MKISIIIPTHNRRDFLYQVIESIVKLKEEAEFEIVIVDNNSTDDTKEIPSYFSEKIIYVFEKCTSFTKARSTGANNATGEILLYIDDDVILNKGSLINLVNVFKENIKCGIVAGKIIPSYQETPPDWTLKCQESFNGWSLYDEDDKMRYDELIKEVEWAAGPMMAIRRLAYDQVNGFPPDTIGVETNNSKKSFNKLYIGPGDYGLSNKVKKMGWSILYHKHISVFHIIPPIRFTIKFWRSRMIGEGYHEAITQREFYNLDKDNSFHKLEKFKKIFLEKEKSLINKINSREIEPIGITVDELWLLYYKAYLDMDYVLSKYKNLSSYLWELGLVGVDDNNFDDVMLKLPEDFKKLVDNKIVFRENQIKSVRDVKCLLDDYGVYNSTLSNFKVLTLGVRNFLK